MPSSAIWATQIGIVVVACLILGCSHKTDQADARPLVPSADRPVAVFVLGDDDEKLLLSSASNGVTFDIDGTGTPVQTGWTRAGSKDAFLFLDVNGNGVVDSGRELLGNGWRNPDGSRVASGDGTLFVIQGILRPAPGPVSMETAQVGPEDEVFKRIRVWIDLNHNGRSELDELQPMEQAGIRMISTDFISLGRKTDESGNVWLLRGWFRREKGRSKHGQMIEVEFARAK